jgi:transposase
MIVGIDISMNVIDACIRAGKRFLFGQFANTGKGRNDFHKWLKKNGVTAPRLFMEATGRYWEPLALWAYKLSWEVTIINPRNIRKFAEGKLGYNKTDKLDAEAILRFAECAEPGELRVWEPRSSEQNELREIQLEITGLEKMIGQERCRLKSGIQSAQVKARIQQTIDYLSSAKKQLQDKAISLIKRTPALSRKWKILKSVRGFGDKSAALLLAKIDFDRFSKGRQIVSYAGIAPKKFQSGKSVNKREYISRVGHAAIRSGLYFPAVVAMTHDPEMKACADRLKAKAKPTKVIICAIMTKLLLKAFALIRDDRFNDELPACA